LGDFTTRTNGGEHRRFVLQEANRQLGRSHQTRKRSTREDYLLLLTTYAIIIMLVTTTRTMLKDKSPYDHKSAGRGRVEGKYITEDADDDDDDDDICSISAEEEFAAEHAVPQCMTMRDYREMLRSKIAELKKHDRTPKETATPEQSRVKKTVFEPEDQSSSSSSSSSTYSQELLASQTLPSWQWANKDRLDKKDREAYFQTLVEI
jgi:hypothetical protein